jgi:hypothetical protein
LRLRQRRPRRRRQGQGRPPVLSGRRPAVRDLDGRHRLQGRRSPGTVDNASRLVGTADYDGDDHGDLLWRQNDDTLFVTLMNGTAFKAGASPGVVDPSWHVIGDQHELYLI